MKKYYWTLESWGDQDPPENADEIISLANAATDLYIDNNPDADDDMIAAYSERLWEDYCSGKAPKTVYIAVDEKTRGDSFDLTVTFDLDEAKHAIRMDFAHLTRNERLNSRRYIDVVYGFGDTPEQIVDSHLIGLGYLDSADCIEFNDDTEQFSGEEA